MGTREQGLVELSGTGLTPEDVVAVARRDARVELGEEAGGRWRRAPPWWRGWPTRPSPPTACRPASARWPRSTIPAERRAELQRALVRSHAAGMGPPVEREVVRAMMLLRARTLAMGYSGARPLVAETMLALLNAGLTPLVPEHGSLGASGDLAPLAHCALVLIGEGELLGDDGAPLPAAGALRAAGHRAARARRRRRGSR